MIHGATALANGNTAKAIDALPPLRRMNLAICSPATPPTFEVKHI